MAIISNKLYVILSPLLAVLIILLEQPHAKNYGNNLSTTEDIVVIQQHQHQHQHRQPQPTIETSSSASSISSSALLCHSPEQITRGQWVPITLPKPSYMPLSPRVRCLRTEDFSKPFSTYIWKPHDDCQVTEWDPYQFCRLLQHNQTISFIGDSLVLEQYASLVHLMGDRARLPPKAVQYGRISRYICVLPQQQQQQPQQQQQQQQREECCIHAVFRTDFFLRNLTEELTTISTITSSTISGSNDQQQSTTAEPIPAKKSEIRSPPPRVVVLNRGAHYVPDDELISTLQTQTLPQLFEWNRQCQLQQLQSSQQIPKCLLIWRTTVPGHPYCQNFTQPSTSVLEMQHWIETKSIQDPNGPYKKGEYHWQDFARQNRLVVQLLQKWQLQLSHIQIEIMDAYQTNILRPDNHRWHMNDCLHTCSPGGSSDWNTQWLLHILATTTTTTTTTPAPA